MTTPEQSAVMEAALFPLGRNPANIMISDISIGNRSLNVFRKYGIQTVADLILNEPNDLTDLRGFGPGCLAETITALREIGFELKPIDYAARR